MKIFLTEVEEDGKRYYYEYLYLSGMVGTLVGFGDIIAKRDPITKFIIIGQVIATLFLNSLHTMMIEMSNKYSTVRTYF